MRLETLVTCKMAEQVGDDEVEPTHQETTVLIEIFQVVSTIINVELHQVLVHEPQYLLEQQFHELT